MDLHCKATADPSQELIYVWKRDGVDIIGNLNIVWLEEENVLRIKDITFKETGVYSCLVYTPKPRGSEDSASAIVSITGEVYCELLFSGKAVEKSASDNPKGFVGGFEFTVFQRNLNE